MLGQGCRRLDWESKRGLTGLHIGTQACVSSLNQFPSSILWGVLWFELLFFLYRVGVYPTFTIRSHCGINEIGRDILCFWRLRQNVYICLSVVTGCEAVQLFLSDKRQTWCVKRFSDRPVMGSEWRLFRYMVLVSLACNLLVILILLICTLLCPDCPEKHSLNSFLKNALYKDYNRVLRDICSLFSGPWKLRSKVRVYFDSSFWETKSLPLNVGAI